MFTEMSALLDFYWFFIGIRCVESVILYGMEYKFNILLLYHVQYSIPTNW
jgi:hypothetical protein